MLFIFYLSVHGPDSQSLLGHRWQQLNLYERVIKSLIQPIHSKTIHLINLGHYCHYCVSVLLGNVQRLIRHLSYLIKSCQLKSVFHVSVLN